MSSVDSYKQLKATLGELAANLTQHNASIYAHDAAVRRVCFCVVVSVLSNGCYVGCVGMLSIALSLT